MIKILSIAVISLSFFACSKNSSSSQKRDYRKQLIGHWNHYRTVYKTTYATGPIDSISENVDSSFFEFNENGKFSKFEKFVDPWGWVAYEDNTGPYSGTFTVEDSIINVKAFVLWGGGPYIIKSISNNTLLLYSIYLANNPLKNEQWYYYTR